MLAGANAFCKYMRPNERRPGLLKIENTPTDRRVANTYCRLPARILRIVIYFQFAAGKGLDLLPLAVTKMLIRHMLATPESIRRRLNRAALMSES